MKTREPQTVLLFGPLYQDISQQRGPRQYCGVIWDNPMIFEEYLKNILTRSSSSVKNEAGKSSLLPSCSSYACVL